MQGYLGTPPEYREDGKYTVAKPSGWIVTRTDDYEAGKAFADANEYAIYLSR